MSESIYVVALEWRWATVHEGWADGTDDVRAFLTLREANAFAKKLNKLAETLMQSYKHDSVVTPESTKIHAKIKALHPGAPGWFRKNEGWRDKTLNLYIVKTLPLGAPK